MIDSFHFHCSPAGYPITSIIALPYDEKAGAILRGRYIRVRSLIMQKLRRPAGPMVIVILLAVCSAPAVFAEDKLQIYPVNAPLAYFAQRIAGDLATVTFPAPRGVDPANWMPDAETIVAYQTADLILLNGAGYAKWTDKASLPHSRLVNTSRGFKDAYIQSADATSHNHGPGGEHAHGGVASTTWLDLSQATQQAEAIARALTRERPDAKEQIDRNLRSLRKALQLRQSRSTA